MRFTKVLGAILLSGRKLNMVESPSDPHKRPVLIISSPDYNLCDELSRVKAQSFGRFGKENDGWGFNTTSSIRVTGRHLINIWRVMRGELNLLQYTMENVTF